MGWGKITCLGKDRRARQFVIAALGINPGSFFCFYNSPGIIYGIIPGQISKDLQKIRRSAIESNVALCNNWRNLSLAASEPIRRCRSAQQVKQSADPSQGRSVSIPDRAQAPSEALEQAEALLRQAAALPSEPPAIQRLNYSHDAMIDMIIANPGVHQNIIARMLGYSPSWVSTIMATDAFQVKLAQRRETIVDPVLKATLEEQARGLYLRSMEIIREKLNVDSANVPDRLAIDVFKESGRHLGLGATPPTPPSGESVSEALVRHADNLVDLLRRKKVEVFDAEVEVKSDANSSAHQELRPPSGGEVKTGPENPAR